MKTLNEINYSVNNQNFLLLTQKALYWQNQRALIISDVHLGKAGHFRKHGIALPQTPNDDNLLRIDALIQQWKPNSILFLGDLFHSEKNEEWNTFTKWRAKHSKIRFELVMGNHDLYPETDYELFGIECYSKINRSGIVLIHDEQHYHSGDDTIFCISGHIHPAIQMKGKGRQRLRLPCFYIQDKSMLLPAFGNLTGNFSINPKKNDIVVAVLENQLVQIR